VLDECGVSGKQLHVAALGSGAGAPADAATVVVSRENLHNEDRLRRDLSAAFSTGARIVDGLGALSIVGAGINATYASVRRGSVCLRKQGIVSYGLSTSSFRTTWLVRRADLDAAVRHLHAAFIEQNTPPVP
jgi:aspartate kinase